MESPKTEIILLLGIVDLYCKTNEETIQKVTVVSDSENLMERREQRKTNENLGDIVKCQDC